MVMDKTISTKKIALGKILVVKKFITNAQLAEALKTQREKNSIKIGDLMVSLGYLAEEQLELAIKKQKKLKNSNGNKNSLGEILVKENYVDRSKLEKALKIQNRQYCAKIGDTLLEMGYVTPEQLNFAIQYQSQTEKSNQWHNNIAETRSEFATPNNIAKRDENVFTNNNLRENKKTNGNRTHKVDKVVEALLKVLLKKDFITKEELLLELSK